MPTRFEYRAEDKLLAMAMSKKKIVSKDDLRRLMREKQSIAKSANKKIEHPLAKYVLSQNISDRSNSFNTITF